MANKVSSSTVFKHEDLWALNTVYPWEKMWDGNMGGGAGVKGLFINLED